MTRFASAHGYDSGPTQRPLLAGAVTAAIAELPALLVLWQSGALRAIADATRTWTWIVLLAHAAVVVVAGLLYGRVFQRAANDRRGGWLFGIGWGYLLWMIGPVAALQWTLGRPPTDGPQAIGLLAAHLLWGLLLGILFPYVHRPLKSGLDVKSRSARGATGNQPPGTPAPAPAAHDRS